MAVYILRYRSILGHREIANAYAQYYVGWAADQDVPRRISQHRQGTSGAALPTAFHAAGIPFVVCRVLWGASRDDERLIKRQNHTRRFDPQANGGRLYLPRSLKHLKEATR